jgi:hypothetical protein
MNNAKKKSGAVKKASARLKGSYEEDRVVIKTPSPKLPLDKEIDRLKSTFHATY